MSFAFTWFSFIFLQNLEKEEKGNFIFSKDFTSDVCLDLVEFFLITEVEDKSEYEITKNLTEVATGAVL